MEGFPNLFMTTGPNGPAAVQDGYRGFAFEWEPAHRGLTVTPAMRTKAYRLPKPMAFCCRAVAGGNYLRVGIYACHRPIHRNLVFAEP